MKNWLIFVCTMTFLLITSSKSGYGQHVFSYRVGNKIDGDTITINKKQYLGCRGDGSNEFITLRGRELSIYSLDGNFIYSLFISEEETDLQSFDSIRNEITKIQQGRQLKQRDTFPTYTCTYGINWDDSSELPECIWTNQSDFGIMRMTLTSPRYEFLRCTCENLSELKNLHPIEEWVTSHWTDASLHKTPEVISHVLFTISNEDKPNSLPSDTTHIFGINDSIHAIIYSESQTDEAQLVGYWYYLPTAQKVAENSTLLSAGMNTSNFDLTNNSPWLVGEYRLLILADGYVVGNEEFYVVDKE